MKQWRTLFHAAAATAALLLGGRLTAPAGAQNAPPPATLQPRPNLPAGMSLFGRPAQSPAMSDPARSNTMDLLARADVQRHLELTIRQKSALQDMQSKTSMAMFQKMRANITGMRDLTPEQRQAQMQEMRTKMQDAMSSFRSDLDKQAAEILRPEQFKRLQELDLQWRGPLALTDPKVAEALEVTQEQRATIATIAQEFRTAQQKSIQAAFESLRNARQAADAAGNSVPMPPPNPAQLQEQMRLQEKEVEKIRKASGDKVLDALTSEQKEKWQAMQGKPFTFRNMD